LAVGRAPGEMLPGSAASTYRTNGGQGNRQPPTFSLSHLAGASAGDLPALFGGDLGEACLDYFFDEGGGERLVGGELDGAFGEGVRPEVVLEFVDDAGGGEEAAVAGKGGEPDDDFAVAKGGNFVADGFCGGRREGGADGSANFLQGCVGGLEDGGEVGVDIFRSGAGLGPGCGSAFSGFLFFHTREATGRLGCSPYCVASRGVAEGDGPDYHLPPPELDRADDS